MTRRTIGRTPSTAGTRARRRTPARSAGQHTGRCRFCRADVFWLAHPTTGKLAPIDVAPQPGGNIIVHRDTAGRLTGTYSVVVKAEQGLFDATISVDIDARPTLHLNHWATCESPTARRLARTRTEGSRLVTVDGDDIGAGDLDPLEAPTDVRAARGCTTCGHPLDPRLLDAEPTTTHPACDPPTDPPERITR